jgi:hypothetical protein
MVGQQLVHSTRSIARDLSGRHSTSPGQSEQVPDGRDVRAVEEAMRLEPAFAPGYAGLSDA